MKHKMPKFKVTIALVPLAILMLARSALAETLQTQNFRVTITNNCPEGYVVCNNITYVGMDLKTGASIRMRGKTLHTTCADGVTPCRFIGYEFHNRDYRYVVTQEGKLSVYRGDKLVVNERGTWK